MLGEAINKAGIVPPTCDHIPSDTLCVPEGLWRNYCYAGQIANSDKPDAKRQAFNRAAKELIAAGRVGKWNDNFWICHPSVTACRPVTSVTNVTLVTV